MYVACSTLCFTRLSLDDALRTIRELRFPKADLAVHAAGPHLTPAEVAADPGGVFKRLKAANLPLAAFHLDTGDARPDAARDQLRAVCRLARVMAVPLLTVPAAPAGADLDAETRRLTDWAATAAVEGVMLTVETHRDRVTADPAGAAELCRRVRGLGLTLDPSHYLTGPHAAGGYDHLMPHVRHVRLRDSGPTPEQFQVRVGQGGVEYGRLINLLARTNFQRALTVDIRDATEESFAVAPEVRKLKYLLESLV